MTDELKTASPTLTLDDETFTVDELAEDVKNLVKVYQRWETELSDAKLEVFKIEAALRALTVEMRSRIKRDKQPTG